MRRCDGARKLCNQGEWRAPSPAAICARRSLGALQPLAAPYSAADSWSLGLNAVRSCCQARGRSWYAALPVLPWRGQVLPDASIRAALPCLNACCTDMPAETHALSLPCCLVVLQHSFYSLPRHPLIPLLGTRFLCWEEALMSALSQNSSTPAPAQPVRMHVLTPEEASSKGAARFPGN